MLVEVIELKDRPWFIGCQFHPEFTSDPRKGHPLFTGFLEAAKTNKNKKASKIYTEMVWTPLRKEGMAQYANTVMKFVPKAPVVLSMAKKNKVGKIENIILPPSGISKCVKLSIAIIPNSMRAVKSQSQKKTTRTNTYNIHENTFFRS